MLNRKNSSNYTYSFKNFQTIQLLMRIVNGKIPLNKTDKA